MNKENVIRALEVCEIGNGCDQCSYSNMDGCIRHMCDDAIKLLRETPYATKMQPETPTYTKAYIFTKTENLVKYFNAHEPTLHENTFERYIQPREVQLILLIRYEGDKCICRIKCPINPLPIKGEFVAVAPGAVGSLLSTLGWGFKECLHLNLFK